MAVGQAAVVLGKLVEKLSGVGLGAFEFDLNPDEFHAYRFFVGRQTKQWLGRVLDAVGQ